MSPESFLSDPDMLWEHVYSIADHVTAEHLFQLQGMLSDRFHGPERQHQRRCHSLSLPLGAHLGMSLGFTARCASSKAPICLGGYAINPSESGGAGETRPTFPRSGWHLVAFSGGVEPSRTRADVLPTM